VCGGNPSLEIHCGDRKTEPLGVGTTSTSVAVPAEPVSERAEQAGGISGTWPQVGVGYLIRKVFFGV
jgi:hypothetical protein